MALDPKHLSVIQSSRAEKPTDICERQLPLRQLYHVDPQAAYIGNAVMLEFNLEMACAIFWPCQFKPIAAFSGLRLSTAQPSR